MEDVEDSLASYQRDQRERERNAAAVAADPTIELHLVGHSAGAIFHAPLVQLLTSRGNIKAGALKGVQGFGLPIKTCTLWAPADWRTEVHYEYDFRDLYYSTPESAIGVPMDKCSLAVVQDEHYKYVHFAALPPLFFDLEADPGQFVNRAGDPAYTGRMAEYAHKMLDWRLGFAERTLTGYRATPKGLEVRAA